MARAPGAGDDEYQELQKRFATLENERKNLFEHTQVLAEQSCACGGSGVSVTRCCRMAARGEKEQKGSGGPQVRQQEAALGSFKLDERTGQEHQQL